MRIMLFVLALALLASSASANKANQRLFDRLSAEFSRFPFDMKEEEAKKLNIKNVVYDEVTNDVSTLIDEAGVVHNFYDGLFSKVITITARNQNIPIKAAGIGLARKKKDVLSAFKQYSGGKKLKCDMPSKDKDGSHYCRFYVGGKSDANFLAEFSTAGDLRELTLQDWDPF
jgi:hypothetical protein